MTPRPIRRRSGILLPLFSCTSTGSWGIGDIGDIRPIAAWLAGAGQRVLQLLPINEMGAGEQSPYSALTAMAIDPLYICLAQVPEWAALGGESSLDADERAQLAHVRQSPRVEYADVRALKQKALTATFERFYEIEWQQRTSRAAALSAFLERESWWVHDYSLFRALHDREDRRPWTEWPEAIRHRDPDALSDARRDLARAVLFYGYLQWIAHLQWEAARDAAHVAGVELFGDLPFMVDGNSADVWAHQHDFHLDASIGVPPDAFSATGQDWGMPAYRWDHLAANDFMWLRERARRSAALFDGFRIDHLVGFYRTYSRSRLGGQPSFSPASEPEQLALGERVLQLFRTPGAEVTAEDLGTVPDFVRASLTRLEIPGYRVFRWERDWNHAGQPFREPLDYPAVSVATSGTHDTETMAAWWAAASDEEREAIAVIPSVRDAAGSADLLTAPFVPVVRDALLTALMASASYLLILPIQDVFGSTDRVNEPATVSPQNWTFRLPWLVDRLDHVPEVRERQAALRALTQAHARTGPK